MKMMDIIETMRLDYIDVTSDPVVYKIVPNKNSLHIPKEHHIYSTKWIQYVYLYVSMGFLYFLFFLFFYKKKEKLEKPTNKKCNKNVEWFSPIEEV
jgi:hypothetical protein